MSIPEEHSLASPRDISSVESLCDSFPALEVTSSLNKIVQDSQLLRDQELYSFPNESSSSSRSSSITVKSILSTPSEDSEGDINSRTTPRKKKSVTIIAPPETPKIISKASLRSSVKNFTSRLPFEMIPVEALNGPEIPPIPSSSQHRRHSRPAALSINQLDLSSLLMETGFDGGEEEEGECMGLSCRSLDSAGPLTPLRRALLNSSKNVRHDPPPSPAEASMSPAHYKHMMRCRAMSEL